jgi:hypothetical protein
MGTKMLVTQGTLPVEQRPRLYGYMPMYVVTHEGFCLATMWLGTGLIKLQFR